MSHAHEKSEDKTTFSLYEVITALRLTAAIFYDKGMKQGKSHEEMADEISPLHHELDRQIHHALEHDFPGLCLAVKSLQHDVKKHEMDIQFIRDKIIDTQTHLTALQEALKHGLKKKGLDQWSEGDYSVTVVDGILTIR